MLRRLIVGNHKYTSIISRFNLIEQYIHCREGIFRLTGDIITSSFSFKAGSSCRMYKISKTREGHVPQCPIGSDAYDVVQLIASPIPTSLPRISPSFYLLEPSVCYNHCLYSAEVHQFLSSVLCTLGKRSETK